MTLPGDLRQGQRVRVLGLYRQRRATFVLDRPPCVLDSGDVLLCGWGGYAFRARFVRADEPVEVLP